jgi:acyl carrier protein
MYRLRRERGPSPAREAVVSAVRSVLIAGLADPDAIARLDDPALDVTFDELGLDSLARLSLAVALYTDHGFAISEEEVVRAGTVGRLAQHLARR